MAEVGLQLYTVGEEQKKDLLGTIEKVAEMGYDAIEFAGYQGIDPTEIRKIMDGCGIKACGTHFVLRTLEPELEQIISDCKTLGTPIIGLPLLGKAAFETEEACQKTAEKLNALGRKITDAGLKFMYHIHGGEFQPVGDTTGLERVIELTDLGLVWLELDTYWVEKDGLDAVELYKKYADRVITVHFKDLVSKEDMRDTEVGTGYIDFPAIIDAAQGRPVEYFVVEQEDWDKRPEAERIAPIESVKISLDNIRNMMT